MLRSLRRRWRTVWLAAGLAVSACLALFLVAGLLAVPGGSGAPPGGSARQDLAGAVGGAAAATGLSPALIQAVMAAESGGNPLAVSRTGALGLMQLEPATARLLGVRDPFDPASNLLGGARYLSSLLVRYRARFAACTRGLVPPPCVDPLVLALAAYNAGPQAVDRYGGVPPYPETRRYVATVVTLYGRDLQREAQAQAQRPASPS